MSSRSRWLRWVSRLPSSDPETYGRRLRYMLAESDVRRSARWTGLYLDLDSGRRYQTAAAAALARVLGGES